MPSYRIFNLDSATGKRGPGEWLDAADDDEAVRLSREVNAGLRREVWLKTRLVAIIGPDGGRPQGEGNA